MALNADRDPILFFQGVRKEFRSFLPRRRVLALDSLDLEVRPGEIVGLVGPNGSGKTTAFRLAAGLIRPDRGTVTVAGALPGSRAARRILGYMPEQPGVPETLTPLELLQFVGRIFGMKRDERRRRIEDLSALLSLQGFLKRRMGGFSKGMIKRVGLAAALFNEPGLLLLDEPLEGLDPLGSASVKDYLKDLAAKGGGILISSHILSDVQSLCHTLLIVNEGNPILAGPKEQILSQRGVMEMRFTSPDEKGMKEKVSALIEGAGGEVVDFGRPRENLEGVFRRLLDRESGGRGTR